MHLLSGHAQKNFPMRIIAIDMNKSQSPAVANATTSANHRSTSPAGDQRLAIGSVLQIRWEERKSGQRQMRVLLTDVRESSLRVQSERAIAAGTLVNLYTAESVPIGRGSIRECTTRAMDYTIAIYLPRRGTPDL
jgi:hypothetical protein